ncbi:MAG: GNAT family N-acetyltransferase [Alteromonadaceae bacterium TMED7]|nr:GNAT family N-acetyltransferase [Alteromonadaceae bacterium]RPH16986.1 MAG: GNAT family N-acetyltransferase [Alteromonadaceae bacterium TMED7]|tara:strand:+ start:52885 stop:53463 length:579 start_codon:yes stop_codon:yes gene_type:complete
MISDTPVNHFRLKAYQVELHPMAQTHQVLMRSWRNQDEIRQQMLSQECISEEQQQSWFKRTQYDPKQLHWVIEFRDTPIGATNVKSLETGKTVQQSAVLEPGLYIGDARYQGNIVAFAPTLAMYDFCFEQLGTQLFRAVVKHTNDKAMAYNRKLGYQLTESGELSVLELNYERYQQYTAPIKQFLSRPRKAK